MPKPSTESMASNRNEHKDPIIRVAHCVMRGNSYVSRKALPGGGFYVFMNQPEIKQRKWKTALLLSIFLPIGVERIYLGKTYTGILKLSLTYLTRSSSSLSIFWFIPVIWWAIDIFLIATRKMKDKEGRELL